MRGIFGIVDAVTEFIERGSERVTVVVELQDLAFEVLVPHQIPTAERFGILGNHLGIVNDSDFSVEIRNRINLAVLRLVVDVFSLEIVRDILVIGDILHRQRADQPFPDHPLDHIIGRDDHVVECRTALDFGIHILVGRESGVIDLYVFTEFFPAVLLEFRVDVKRVFVSVRNIFAPVIDVERDRLVGFVPRTGRERRNGQHQQADEQKNCKNSFHFFAPAFLTCRLSRTAPTTFTAISTPRTTNTSRVQSAYILNFTSCTVWL